MEEEALWDKVLGRGDLEFQWGNFKTHYHYLTNKYVPRKTIKAGRPKSPPRLFNKMVKQAKKNKKLAWRKYKEHRLNVDKAVFDEAASKEKEAIEKAKIKYEASLMNKVKENPNAFYNYVGMYTKSSSTIDVLEVEDEKVYDDSSMASALNDFFTTIMTEEPPMHHSLPVNDIYIPYDLCFTDFSSFNSRDHAC